MLFRSGGSCGAAHNFARGINAPKSWLGHNYDPSIPAASRTGTVACATDLTSTDLGQILGTNPTDANSPQCGTNLANIPRAVACAANLQMPAGTVANATMYTIAPNVFDAVSQANANAPNVAVDDTLDESS